MKKPGEGTIIAVDLLRFVCALLVLGYHFGVAFWLSPSPHGEAIMAGAPWRFDGTALARVGWIGVELFFVISGLVIARSAVGLRWTDFLWKRTLRLAPAAWICATISLVVLAASGRFGLPDLIDDWWRSLRFWPVGEQIDGSYWTLGIEISFYLLMALAAAGGSSARRIEAIGVAVGVASAAFWLWWLWAGASPDLPLRNRTMMLTLLPHGCFFAIGVMIAALTHDGMTWRRGVTLALLMPVAAIEIVAHTAERAEGIGAMPSGALAGLLFFGGVAVLIAAPRLQPLLARRITPRVARTIGLMTYPLYLLHQDAGAALLVALAGAGASPRLAAGLSAAAILTLAWLVACWLEPVLRRLLAAAPVMVGRRPSPVTMRS
jgi:peptidoglycan/LPS O-acetylase OafA/YrhL